MSQNKIRKDNITDEFWDKYVSEDYLGRKMLCKELVVSPVLSEVIKGFGGSLGNENIAEYTLLSLIQSYLDDLLEYLDKKEKEGSQSE